MMGSGGSLSGGEVDDSPLSSGKVENVAAAPQVSHMSSCCGA